MRKATPVEMRKALELVNEFKRLRIRFVPIPVFDDNDYEDLKMEMIWKLNDIEKRNE